MSLSVGIVGLPNVGKSTLFNALLKKQQAHIANFPFTTIEPNVGIVPVSDPRLEKLAQVIAESEGMKTPPPIVPATVKFIDIAGLVAGAHKGEGLGNQFLAHIREATAICHVLRLFEDPNVSKEGSDPVSDFQTVETELKLADLATLEKQVEPKGTTDKDESARWEVVKKLRQVLETGTPARGTDLDEKEQEIAQTLSLLTAKPILAIINIAEKDLKRISDVERDYAQKLNLKQDQVVAVSAKLENELAQLPQEEQEVYLTEYAIENPSLERLIKKAYTTLDLISFLTTTGGKEVRAWTLRRGETALKAAGTIHSDFEKNLIKADVIPFEDLVSAGGWKTAREQGKVHPEGKDYLVQDGEVIEFKIGK